MSLCWMKYSRDVQVELENRKMDELRVYKRNLHSVLSHGGQAAGTGLCLSKVGAKAKDMELCLELGQSKFKAWLGATGRLCRHVFVCLFVVGVGYNSVEHLYSIDKTLRVNP